MILTVRERINVTSTGAYRLLALPSPTFDLPLLLSYEDLQYATAQKLHM